MRVLIFTTQDRFFLSHVLERALYFQKQGCIVGVAVEKTSQELQDQITSYGFEFYDTKIERQSINPFTQVASIFRVFKIQNKFHPDVLYNLGAKAIFYGTFVSKLRGDIKFIVNAPIGLGYVYASKTFKARLLRPIVSFLYGLFLNPKNSNVIVENLDDINFFIKKGYLRAQNAYCILGAGVNTSKFSPLSFSSRNKVCTVVFAARLIREKGIDDFVKVANILYKKKVSVRMQIVGEPDYGNPSSLSQQEFEKIKNNPAVECLGFVKEMDTIYRKAHICCLPSFYREGLPRVLVEATSCGLAILTTNTIGCKESIRENNGFLVQPHDIERMSHLIEYLVKNPSELNSMCQNSRKVALSYFDSDIICERTYRIIAKMEGIS